MFGIDKSLTSNVTSLLSSIDRSILTPNQFYGTASSMMTAAALGGIYGLVGRVISPQANIQPFNYIIWFTVAFQIESMLEIVGELIWDKMNQKSNGSHSTLKKTLHNYTWKIISHLTIQLEAIDRKVSVLLNIRPFQEVDQKNVNEAKFLEMCRYRIWKVFKGTLLDMLSFNLAHYFTTRSGLFLPQRTIVPLFIVIRSIMKDIVIIPCCHIYMRFLNQLAASIEEKKTWQISQRIQWMNRLVPEL